MIEYLIFGDFDSRDYNLAVVSRNTFDNPRREVRKIEVPGRNGALYEDLGFFKNQKMQYDLIAYNIKDADVFFDDIKKKFFIGSEYKRLEDSENVGKFMLAKFDGGLSVSRKSRHSDAFIFSVSFDRKPQKFLKIGEYELSSPDELYNPGAFASRPIIKFKTIEQSGRINIGDSEILISGAIQGEELLYDSETMSCRTLGGENRNYLIYTEKPVELSSGLSTVHSEGIVQLKVVPRWWTL